MCKGLMGKIFGHKFEAQFDSCLPSNIPHISGRIASEYFSDVLDSCRTKTYRGSVCRRCGATVNAVAVRNLVWKVV